MDNPTGTQVPAPPDHAHLEHAAPGGCSWCAGYRDGFLAGPDGLDPDGNRHDYDPALLGQAEYRAGASVGRSDRIDLHHAALAQTTT